MSDTDSAMDATTSQAQAGGPASGLIVRDAALSPFQSPPTQAFPSSDDPLAGGIDYARAWHSFRRRWFSSTVLGLLLGTAAGIATWVFLPRGYEAVAWLRVRDKSGMLSVGGRDSAEYESFRKTQVQLIKSPFVLNAALRRPGISELPTLKKVEDPVGFLASYLQVTAPMESEVLQIRLRAESAEDTAKIVNAVTASYLDDIVNKDRADRLGRRDILEKKHKENQAELRRLRETFNTLARQLGTQDSLEVATQRSLLLDHLQTLRAQVTQAQREVTSIDTELAVMEAKAKNEISAEGAFPEEIIEATLARDPEIVGLLQQRGELDQSIAMQEQRSARGGNEPTVKRLRAQRTDLSERIDLRRAELRPMIVAQLAADVRGNRSGVLAESPAVLQMRREILVRELDQTSREFEKISKEVTALGKVNADLEVRKSEIENLRMVTDRIGHELESTSIDLSMPNRVTLIEEASVPEGSDRLFRTMVMALASAAGFVAGGGLIVLVEYLRNRLSSPEEMTQRVGVRVLGTLPRVSRGRRGGNDAIVSESMDGIRTLVLQTGRQAPKVILVTSAVEQEGKTTVASRLAASLARSDKRTLLIDGDLRHPNVHLALDLDVGNGLSEVLRGEVSIDEAIQPTAIEGLFAVTAGGCDYAAVMALSRPELGKVFKHLRESFDHVVIDAGPVLAFADALLLGQQSDVSIVTALKDSSVVPNVVSAIDRLRAVGVRVVGTVVNGVKQSGPRRLYASPLPT